MGCQTLDLKLVLKLPRAIVIASEMRNEREDFAPALKLDLKLDSSQAKAVKMRLAVVVIVTTLELLPKINP